MRDRRHGNTPSSDARPLLRLPGQSDDSHIVAAQYHEPVGHLLDAAALGGRRWVHHLHCMLEDEILDLVKATKHSLDTPPVGC